MIIIINELAKSFYCGFLCHVNITTLLLLPLLFLITVFMYSVVSKCLHPQYGPYLLKFYGSKTTRFIVILVTSDHTGHDTHDTCHDTGHDTMIHAMIHAMILLYR